MVLKFFVRSEGLASTSAVLNDMPLGEIIGFTCFSFFQITFAVPFVTNSFANVFLGGYLVVVKLLLRSKGFASTSPGFTRMPLCEIVVFTCFLFFQIIFNVSFFANSFANVFLGGYSVVVKFFLRSEGLASTSPVLNGRPLCEIVAFTCFSFFQIIFGVPFVASRLANIFLGG